MSWRFLVDEDMPRSAARTLREAGYLIDDVRDVGLRGHTDQEVFAYAQANSAILISADKGFANLFVFPPASHAGIIVVRVPDTLPTAMVNEELLRALSSLVGTDLAHTLVVIEPGRARIRR
jgi:predicted nuclease of predicted toxin-antitoxin system